MLAQARRTLPIRLVRARAEELPLASESADYVTMGYALRHVSDLTEVFREFHRVLKPGGTVCLLEITQPRSWISRQLLSLHLRTLVPMASRFSRRPGGKSSRLLWQYYGDTISACVEPQCILDALVAAGFECPTRQVSLGIFSEYTARKCLEASEEPSP